MKSQITRFGGRLEVRLFRARADRQWRGFEQAVCGEHGGEGEARPGRCRRCGGNRVVESGDAFMRHG